ncbi:UV DNA damage repair endonuclease UvsE [Desulfopila sp. IMCC35006]|uniref:UV DNA damage repair endonuclease UvsE n=1 Tax=Desulfopila sp. IMCC35006 TaxID=2569542 RepID=UPI0010AD92B0|nr:UV DNA damage repair endonuclease UvsE [Desulfopila sp. IMCC35006]TKB23902.1 UV DNA damage repair endonuclease UvsE [Desulfopila sp. IMCC35006]
MRFGLCCLFKEEKIAFRTTTAKVLSTLPRGEQLKKLSTICHNNSESLVRALHTVQRLGIGAFRIMSPLFPRMTHPEVGYTLGNLPDAETIGNLLAEARSFAHTHDIRLSFHPDQFVVLSSPRPEVIANSIRELEYQAWLAEEVGANIINLHAGGVYGDKSSALQRFCEVFADLPENIRSRLTLENDDVSYTVSDLLPVCEKLAIPLVYDVHHHRCNPDGLSVEEATELAGATWHRRGREQYCHLSSPKSGWGGGDPKPHADYIHPEDLPDFWRDRAMTVDIEAKAKELAVIRLMTTFHHAR